MIAFRIEKYEEFKPRVTITSALPYVNGVKHIGNIVGSLLPADIFHRFLDLFGIDNIYICGTDDHGTPSEISAAEEGLAIEKYVKKYYKVQADIYKLWNFDFTHFGSTSSETNHKITQAIFLACYKNGYIIRQNIIVPYCEDCMRFLPDRYITGECPVCSYDSARGDQCESCSTVLDPSELKNPKCIICGGNKIEFRNESHLFLDYSTLSDKLEKWIEKNEHWPYNTRNLALGWIKQGLKPRCITRNLDWGVKVPLKGFEHLVFYVWFDAPIGYISITKDAAADGKIKKWKEYWTDSKIFHFLGKDNVPFHTIFWPGTLMAAKGTMLDKPTDFSLPYKVVGYEYLNWEGRKFSTSKGIGLFSDEVLELFPTDYWRFYLSYILPENKDSNFDWDDFAGRINNGLIANYGNLFYRVTYFIKEHFEGRVPKGRIDKEGERLYKLLDETAEKIEKDVKEVKLREALKRTLAFASSVNKYFQDKKPWFSIKENKYEAANTLYTSVNLLRSLSVLLYPFMPSTAGVALSSLGVKKIKWFPHEKLKPGQKIDAKILFKKIEKDELEKAKAYVSKYAKAKPIKEKTKDKDADTIKTVDNMIPFEEFKKLELVVGTIRSVEDHPDASKLYVMQVDLGKEIRQIVAGLKDIYKKDELEGKQIILVANLEPKELRGVKSHGMLLAADDGTIVSPEKVVPNGARVI